MSMETMSSGSAIVIAKAARASNCAFPRFDVFGMIPAPNSVKDDEQPRLRYRTIERGESKGIGGDSRYGYGWKWTTSL